VNEVTLDPDAPAIRRFINRAVEQNLSESPVGYAFEDGWPVHISQLEGQEVLQAVRNCEPYIYNPHGNEHKELAVKEVMDSLPE
jgi:hypothetical protein